MDEEKNTSGEKISSLPENGIYNLDDFHVLNDRGNPSEPLDDVIVDTIIRDYDVFVMNDKPYLYTNGVYVLDKDGKRMKKMIRGFLYQRFRKMPIINRIYALLISDFSIHLENEEVNNYPKSWINFRNGFLDLRTMEMQGHSPQYFAINQIPCEWKNSGVSPDSVADEFLQGLIPDPEDREMVLEYVAYCMTKDMSLQKFMILKGKGGLGKSVLLSMIISLIGSENTCALKLQNLNDRFSSVFLIGKLLNCYADLPSQSMEDVSGIKTIVGEDWVRGEYKGGDVFQFHPFSKLLFSANRIPQSKDDNTDAYYRRILIVKIDQRCHEIPHLTERLSGDMDSFLQMVVEAGNRLYQRERILESARSKKEVLELYMETDSVKAFLHFKTISSEHGKVKRTVLYDEYKEYCKEAERQETTRNGFYANLREKGYGESASQGEDYFTGLELASADFVPCDFTWSDIG